MGLLFVVATLNTHLSKSRTLDIAHASMSPALCSFTGVILQSRDIQGPVDWIFHNAVPVFASLILIGGGAGLIAGAAFGPFAVAGASTLLLVSGFYRTWGETLALIGVGDNA